MHTPTPQAHRCHTVSRGFRPPPRDFQRRKTVWTNKSWGAKRKLLGWDPLQPQTDQPVSKYLLNAEIHWLLLPREVGNPSSLISYIVSNLFFFEETRGFPIYSLGSLCFCLNSLRSTPFWCVEDNAHFVGTNGKRHPKSSRRQKTLLCLTIFSGFPPNKMNLYSVEHWIHPLIPYWKLLVSQIKHQKPVQ